MAYVPYILGEVVADEHGNLFRRADGRKVQWEPRKFEQMELTGGGEPGPPGTTDWDGLTNVPAVIAGPERFGAAGDGTTDDTAAFVTTFTDAIATVLRKSYRLNQFTITNEEIRGDHYNLLRAATANPILRMRTGSAIENVTIDGEGSTSRRVDVGGTGDENISIRNVVLIDCPLNSFRAISDTSGVRVVNVYADNAKVFNTDDVSDVKNLLFTGIISVNSPDEAFLLDFPGTTPEWTGFSLSNSIWEMAEGNKRPVSIARAVGGVITGQVMRGSYQGGEVTGDLIHVEDKAEMIAIVGNVMETNGQFHAVDGALGGDPLYPQDDRNPKDLLYTSNLYRATNSDTSHLIWLEGSRPAAFNNVTIVNETLLCNEVAIPLQVNADSGIFGRNNIYGATAPEWVRSGNSDNSDNSDTAPNVVRLPSHHVNPRFLRGTSGHGYSPENVLFRTSFGFDTYTNFQTWANTVKTITGATVTAFGGSLGTGTPGTITFPVDTATGARFMRVTRGSVAMSVRFDFVWNVHDIDFQNLDEFCVRLLTRSSVQTAGKLTMEFPFAASTSLFTKLLNSGTDFASWKADGGGKAAPVGASFYSASAGTIKFSLYPGDGLVTAGDTVDYGILAVSVNRSTPF